MVAPAGRRPAYRLRHEFTLADAPAAATAWATAPGVYELFVNGEGVGDLELTPGFTAYRRRLQVQSYDVAHLLRAGTNAVEVLLSDGWFRGRHGFERRAEGFGDRVAALLAITDGDSTSSPPVRAGGHAPAGPSRTSWTASTSTCANRSPGWARPGGRRCTSSTGGLYADRGRLVRPVAPPGRNLNGWVRCAASVRPAPRSP